MRPTLPRVDFALYRTIARQGGVFTVSQALDSCSDTEVRRLVRTGRWRRSSLGTDDAVLVDGVWCTPAARTACDVVRLTPAIDGLATLDAALRAGRCTRDQLTEAATAQAGLRQVVRLRGLVPHADPRPDSPMESRMRWRFLTAGFPAPDVQVEVPVAGRSRWMDTGWREQRVGAEFDGQEAHMTPQQLRDDRRRHNWLTEHGWTLLHVTKDDVYRQHLTMLAVTARALRLPPGSWRS